MSKLQNGIRAAAAVLALVIAPATILAQRPHSTAADKPVWNQKAKDEVIEGMSNYVLNSAYVPGIDFSTWKAELAKIRVDADKAKSEDEFAGLINRGLHEQFNISHIVLMPPSAVEARTSGSKVGIGVRIQIQEDGVFITSIIPGGPAEKAGLEAGDLIMEADGHKAEGPTYIAGDQGTSVNLKVKKADGTIKMYKVVRQPFSTVQPEELTWVNKDTAVLAIHTFDLSYSRDNVEKLMKEALPAKNLIVDLRNNGGGAVMNMLHFLSMVLPKGTEIGTFINKRLIDNYVEETKGDPKDLKAVAAFAPNKIKTGSSPIQYKGNVAVLVNGGSGSASEITAEALKEQLNAPVVGQKSAGAVLVSVISPLPRGFNMQYPISDYVSVKGVRLEANGIVPDAQSKDVAYLKKGEQDPAWLLAINLLAKTPRTASGN